MGEYNQTKKHNGGKRAWQVHSRASRRTLGYAQQLLNIVNASSLLLYKELDLFV